MALTIVIRKHSGGRSAVSERRCTRQEFFLDGRAANKRTVDASLTLSYGSSARCFRTLVFDISSIDSKRLSIRRGRGAARFQRTPWYLEVTQAISRRRH